MVVGDNMMLGVYVIVSTVGLIWAGLIVVCLYRMRPK